MRKFILAVVGIFFTLIYPSWAKNPKTSLRIPSGTAIYAVWAQTGEPIVAQQEKLPLNPASAAKLITSYCSLKTLGPDYRFKTWFYSEKSIQNGTIQNLWIKGEGDPSLVSEFLLEIAKKFASLGLKKITGDIFVDASYFDSRDYPGRQENNERAYNAPTSAVSLNFNSVAAEIASEGGRLLVEILPNAPSYLKVQSKIRPSGKRARIYIDSKIADNSEIITLAGNFSPHSGPVTLYRSVRRPSELFGHALVALLQENGVAFQGSVRTKMLNASHPLLIAESKPLREIIGDMNKFSNNFIAEQLTKYLGARAYGPPASTQKGVAVLKNCLAKTGVDISNLYLENGSGLSYNNRVTAEQLVKILTTGFRDSSIRDDFISSLSVAGVDGTMKSRRSPKGLEGVLRAKTGSLNGISTLAGFIPASDGQVIAFAILMNNLRKGVWEAQRIQDDLVLKWTVLKKVKD